MQIHPTPRHAAYGFILALTFTLLDACSGRNVRQFQDPVAAATDRDLASRENLAALQQARDTAYDDPERIEMLKEIISGPQSSLEMRTLAFTQLEEFNSEMARQVLHYRLPTHRSWSFIDWVCDLIVQRRWTDMTPSLVRSLDRFSPAFEDEDRPERRALLALHEGKDLRQIVADLVLTVPDNAVHEQWRQNAWELLNRLGPADPWAPRLAALKTDDPFLITLRDAYNELGVIARTREEVRWVEYLARPENAAVRESARQIVARIDPAYRADLRPRHLGTLVAVNRIEPRWLDWSSQDIVSHMNARLIGREHFHPDSLITVRAQNTGPQSFKYWHEQLSWPDLLTVLLADRITHDPAVQAQLLAQARRDHQDESTEYGGLLTISADGVPQAVLYPPIHRSHDRKFYAPDAMVADGYEAPFHYHFHVQEQRNREYAGPGQGDMQYANSMSVAAVVFTYIKPDRLNADFYTQNKVVIDLGTFGNQ